MTVAAALAEVLPAEAIADPEPGRWATLGGDPEAVVSPDGVESVASVMEWASSEGVGVVPAGSGLRLGPRAMEGRFVVLTSDRLRGIEIYEPADVTFTAGAGTRLRDIDRELRANAQWLPFDPPDVLDRTLGGMVAAGVSGPLWMGYGELRNHVLGMTVVTGDGRVLRLGGRVVKNVAGFDVLKPVVGSRGTLAMITSVCMRAFPEPAAERVLVLRAETLDQLVPAAQLVGTAPVMPVSSVIVSSGGEAALIVRLHGAPQTVDADQASLERHVGVRFDTGTARVGGSSTAAVVVTMSVLPSRLADAADSITGLAPEHVSIDSYAARLRVSLSRFDPDAIRRARIDIEQLGGACVIEQAPPGASLGGVASEPSADERRLAARVKRAFDPEGVLWRS